MALVDLKVYSEYAYLSATEVLRQQIDLFNAQTGGAVMLQGTAHQGDFSQEAIFKKVQGGLVRRRNAYGSGGITGKSLSNIEDVSVKVAAGTPEMHIDPGQFRWIQQNPEVAGTVLGQQLAADMMADMLNTGLGVAKVALSGVPEVNYDATATADKLPTFKNYNKAQALFGDAGSEIIAWLMHSSAFYDLYGDNLTNNERLFTYGSVNVMRDPTGKLLIMTDSPQLIDTDNSKSFTLGLTAGGIMIGQNNDFDAAEESRTGNENLGRTYQAEWSFNVGVKGFAWDIAAGGKSPTDAALLTSTNWDRYATSEKDLAGVLLTTN